MDCLKSLNGFTVAIALVCLTWAPVSAQGHGKGRGDQQMDPEQRVQKQMDRISEELSLSDDQRAQVEPILVDSARQLSDLRREIGQGGGGNEDDRRAVREAMREIQHETNSKLAEILDEDQMQDLRELQRQRREKMRERGGRKGGPQGDA